MPRRREHPTFLLLAATAILVCGMPGSSRASCQHAAPPTWLESSAATDHYRRVTWVGEDPENSRQAPSPAPERRGPCLHCHDSAPAAPPGNSGDLPHDLLAGHSQSLLEEPSELAGIHVTDSDSRLFVRELDEPPRSRRYSDHSS